MNIFIIITFSIMIIILSILSLKFFLHLKYNIEFKNKKDALIGTMSFIILLFLSTEFGKKHFYNIINYLSKYTMIPVYLFSHLLIFTTMTMIYSLSYLYLNSIINGPKENRIYILILSFIYKLIKNIKFVNNNIIFFKKIFELNQQQSILKSIKTKLLIFYLISGIIIVSPFQNFLLSRPEMKEYIDILTRDYELYKNIFIISLVPVLLKSISKENIQPIKIYE